MSLVHTINNACLTVFGLMIGKTNFTRVISETIAMGMDNDCTAATAGSIVGAIIGKKNIPKHWIRPFKNTVHTYLIGKPKFTISNLKCSFSRKTNRSCTHLRSLFPKSSRVAGSDQVTPRHTKGFTYRCYLPVLTGFGDLPLRGT